MKAKLMLLVCLLALTGGALAQGTGEQRNDTKNEESVGSCRDGQQVTKLLTAKHYPVTFLSETLKLMLSRYGRLTPNQAIKTLVVNDCPANVAIIEQTLAKLDVPEPAPPSMEFQLHLLAASAKAVESSTTMPKQLEPVVAQLKATLKYGNYRYVYSALNRITNVGGIESSGVTGELFPTPPGVTQASGNPSFYRYSLRNVKFTQDATGKDSVQIEQFNFGISVPIQVGAGQTQYKDIGLVTPLSLREGEIAVVGTANISGSDEAMIVVVSVKKLK